VAQEAAMTDLAEFLLARVAEDEAVARKCPPSPWTVDGDGCCVLHSGHDADRDIANMTDAAEHIAHWDPARVLAECDAKKAIAEAWQQINADDRVLNEYAHNIREGRQTSLYFALKVLALPYADHSEYRSEWKL